MDQLLLPVAFVIGLTTGPFLVAKVWPSRSRCVGTVAAGECGVVPLFWGLTFGCAFGYLVLAILISTTGDALASPATKAQLIAIMFAFMAAVVAPLVVCGFHSWKWDENGLEFVGAFRRKTIRWANIASVRRIKRAAWKLQATNGTKISVSGYVTGERFIITALCANRQDLAPQITAAIEAERV